MYFRRNFRQVERPTHMDGEETELIWLYEEATLSKDEALQYLTEQNQVLAKVETDNNEIAVDHEYRLTMLELGLTDEI